MKRSKTKLVIIAALALSGIIIFNACSKSSGTPPLPPVNGYNTSNDVAATNLLAHWTFDGTNNETISGTAPTTSTGASFVTGVKGQALSLNKGFLLFPSIAKLSSANAFPSVSVSCWVNTDNRDSLSSSVMAITQSTSAQTDWNDGPVNMIVETGKKLTVDDTLVLHSFFSTWSSGSRQGADNINDYGVRGTDFQTVLGTNKWVHYVMRYDGSSSNFDIYANGVLVSNNKFRNRTTGNPPVGLGPIVSPVPTQVLIGAFPNVTSGFTNSVAQSWQGLFVGKIDEIRVYNSALTDLEIGSLYQLELAGR